MKPKAVTLIELLIAITLLGVVVLAAMAYDSVSRRFLWKNDRRTQALNEATFVLEHISKQALLGIGTVDRPAIRTIAGPKLVIRQDTNQNGVYEPNVDSTATYEYLWANSRLNFCLGNDNGVCVGGVQVVSNNITMLWIPTIDGQTADIRVTARCAPPDPTMPAEQVSAQTIIEAPAQSLQ